MSDFLFEKGNVRVSKGLVEVGSVQYQIRQINRIDFIAEKPRRLFPILLVIFSTIVLLGSISDPKWSSTGIAGGILSLGILILVKQRTKYHLVFNTSSGNVQALTSIDAQFIGEVRSAINHAQENLAA